MAILDTDCVKSEASYVNSLAKQWGLPIPSEPDGAALQQLLDRDGSPVIQVLTRFDKILDVLDQAVLGALRQAEQSRSLLSVTFSFYDYTELKRQWRTRDHVFVTSDYGDTHDRIMPGPLSEPEMLVYFPELPLAVARFAYALSGGFPVPAEAVARRWTRLLEPRLDPQTRKTLTDAAAEGFERYIEKLDTDSEQPGRFRDALIDLAHDLSAVAACNTLSSHPWERKARYLLVEGRELRSEALGMAAISARIASVRRGESPQGRLLTLDLAQRLYSEGMFSQVSALLSSFPSGDIRASVLKKHARLMESLARATDVDGNWSSIAREAAQTRADLELLNVDREARELLSERYVALEEVCVQLAKALRSGERRPIDALVGLNKGTTPHNPEIALLLLDLRLRSARAIAAPSLAHSALLPLPEQILRAWGKLCLNLSYYKAPSISTDIWKKVSAYARREVSPVLEGESFPSQLSFAYCSFALQEASAPPTVLFEAVEDVEQYITDGGYRNDSAHSLALTPNKVRNRFVQRIDSWLNVLARTIDPARPHLRTELADPLEPLPVLGENCELVWL
ncbi:MAG: hypothetical protein JKY65_04065 [Planctomycetes bacterium]|nr:hypothetical protein [Planctomycetota bacterium]